MTILNGGGANMAVLRATKDGVSYDYKLSSDNLSNCVKLKVNQNGVTKGYLPIVKETAVGDFYTIKQLNNAKKHLKINGGYPSYCCTPYLSLDYAGYTSWADKSSKKARGGGFNRFVFLKLGIVNPIPTNPEHIKEQRELDTGLEFSDGNEVDISYKINTNTVVYNANLNYYYAYFAKSSENYQYLIKSNGDIRGYKDNQLGVDGAYCYGKEYKDWNCYVYLAKQYNYNFVLFNRNYANFANGKIYFESNGYSPSGLAYYRAAEG